MILKNNNNNKRFYYLTTNKTVGDEMDPNPSSIIHDFCQGGNAVRAVFPKPLVIIAHYHAAHQQLGTVRPAGLAHLQTMGTEQAQLLEGCYRGASESTRTS